MLCWKLQQRGCNSKVKSISGAARPPQGMLPSKLKAAMERSSSSRVWKASSSVSCTLQIQQDLARPGVLEHFVPDAAAAELLRSCFAGANLLHSPRCSSPLQAALMS